MSVLNWNVKNLVVLLIVCNVVLIMFKAQLVNPKTH